MKHLSRRHDVLVLFALLFVSCIICGCPKREQQVDTSHKLLIETAKALSTMDQLVSRQISRASNEAIGETRQAMGVEEMAFNLCIQTYEEETCVNGISQPMDIYASKMEPWYNLTEFLSTVAEILRTWDRINAQWRMSGSIADNWDERVCFPLQETTGEIGNLLVELKLTIPVLWQGVTNALPVICSIGSGFVMTTENATGINEVTNE